MKRIIRNLLTKIQRKKFYLTEQGLKKIKRDYQNLKSLKLLKATGETPNFFHSDDLDPEYLDFQDDMTLLEAKLADLEQIIENAEVIKPSKKEKEDIVKVGSKVLVDINGKEEEFTILGTLEANPSLGIISNESPAGRALLGHKTGDQIIISSPAKTIYEIKKIRYS